MGQWPDESAALEAADPRPDVSSPPRCDTFAPMADFLLPGMGTVEVAVSAPGEGIGRWAGGPSAVPDDGSLAVAYRIPRG